MTFYAAIPGIDRCLGRVSGWLIAHERRAIAIVIFVGMTLRVFLAVATGKLTPLMSESHNIAASLASDGTFANAFAVASGPTAHVGMLTPLPAALAYYLLGTDTGAAESALAIWAVGTVGISIWLCWRIMIELDTPRAARIAAVCFASLVPIQLALEVRDLRSWEVGVAACLMLGILLRLLTEHEAPSRPSRLVVTGALSALTFIVSPPAGLATIAAIAIFSLWKLPLRRWWIAALAFVVTAALFVVPWQHRNERALGVPIALRSNFGLELSLSAYAGAINPSDPAEAYQARLRAIHPHTAAANRERMDRAGGEVSYYRALGAAAQEWVKANPSEFARLCFDHLRDYFFPSAWLWKAIGQGGLMVEVRQIITWLFAAIALLTLVVKNLTDWKYRLLAVSVVACALPYIPVQPMLRYRYLISTLFIFLAFDGLGRMLQVFSRSELSTRLKVRHRHHAAPPGAGSAR